MTGVAVSGDDVAPTSARSLLLTILGELVRGSERPAWTSGLVTVMGGLGIEEPAARQAIMRTSRSGWIAAHRHGRAVAWTLTPALERVFDDGERRVVGLREPFVEWDGTWLIVLVTVPHERRAVRRRLYAGLTWAGFGNPAPGVWVTPHVDRRADASALIAELGLTAQTLALSGRLEPIGVDSAEVVARGWDLGALAQRYESLWEAVSDLRPAAGDETLFAHLRMLDAWKCFPFSDPQLPVSLAPEWIGRRVSAGIEELRERWAPEARRRWAELDVEP